MIAEGLKYNCLVRWSLQESIHSNKERWNGIVSAMEGNESVRDVYIGPGFYSQMPKEDFAGILQHMGEKLINLRVLCIGTLDSTKIAIESTSIASFVRHAKNLQTLRIERNLSFQSLEEVQSLGEALRSHESLRRISLPNLHPSWTKCSLDPLLSSLADMTGLESLQLGLSEECFNWSTQVSTPQVLGMLGSLPNLKWLVISRLHVEDQHVQELCQAIATFKAPIKILDITKTRRVTEHAWEAILQLLMEGCSLESVDMYCSPNAMKKRAQALLYFKMNRDGRRKMLRETTSKEEWIDIVGRYFVNDMLALYVLLQESPWVCIQEENKHRVIVE